MSTISVAEYGAELVRDHQRDVRAFADRLIAKVTAAQLGAIGVLCGLQAWAGGATPGVAWALFGVATMASATPLLWMWRRGAGQRWLCFAFGAAQIVASEIVVRLAGGNGLEQFHLFASLALLALYRDWRVLVASSVLALVLRTVASAAMPGEHEPFNWISIAQHAGWLALANGALIVNCLRATLEMSVTAQRQAALELLNVEFEERVGERTAELAAKADALRDQMNERAKLESQLHEAQRLESIGQLAAGVAHEINTPVQYVSDNVRFLRDRFGEVLGVTDAYAEALDPARPAAEWAARSGELQARLKELDFDFLRTEVPRAIDESLEGLQRVTTIVRAMKDFSHPGSDQRHPADLNHALESTTIVCKNRWKFVADLQMDLEPELPEIPCMVGELNQVFLNLIVNAADAIAERYGNGAKGMIKVTSRKSGDFVEVSISDNGGGIPLAVQPRIFDPFFTTKEVGKGTGQGLAISRNVVVKKHGGTLEFSSVPGEGTTFTVRLPVRDPFAASLKEAA